MRPLAFLPACLFGWQAAPDIPSYDGGTWRLAVNQPGAHNIHSCRLHMFKVQVRYNTTEWVDVLMLSGSFATMFGPYLQPQHHTYLLTGCDHLHSISTFREFVSLAPLREGITPHNLHHSEISKKTNIESFPCLWRLPTRQRFTINLATLFRMWFDSPFQMQNNRTVTPVSEVNTCTFQRCVVYESPHSRAQRS